RCRSNDLEFRLAKTAAQHRNVETGGGGGGMKGADEIVARTSDQRVEDDRRLAANDLVDDVVDRALAQFEQPFRKNASLCRRHQFTRAAIGFPGPDVVVAEAE